MKKMKGIVKQILVMLCITSLLIPMCEPLTVYAYKKVEGLKEVKSSTFAANDLPYSWSAKIDGKTITFELECAEAAITSVLGLSWNAFLWGSTGVKQNSANFSASSGKCSISSDLSALDDGIGDFVAVYVYAENVVVWSAAVYLEVENGEITIHSPYGKAAVDDMAYYNKNYDPKSYLKQRFYALNLAEYDEIVAKAQELTANCTTDVEKVKEIHDWICKNIAYDVEANKSGNISLQNDAGWTFTNKRAVCGGFAKLTEIMCRSAGVPCMYIEGRGYDVLSDGAENKLTPNHGWNIVYCDGSWRYLDTTWDCGNKYYGEGSEKNTRGKTPEYTYFGTSPEYFGLGHYAMRAETEGPVEKIEIRGPKTQYFLGGEFVNPKYVYLVTTDNKSYQLTDTSRVEYSGYDFTKTGKQTVTASFKGFTTTYEIEVLDGTLPVKITAEKTKTVYEVGDKLDTNDLKVTVRFADATEKTVTDYEISNVDMNTAGDKTLKVSYKGKTAEIAIKVNPHVVKFDANGGTKLSKSSISISTHNAKIGTLPTVERSGYNFKGWYTAKTGGTKVTTATQIAKSMTVYAQWTKVTAPGKGKTPTLKSKKSGQVTVTYKKVTGAKGYEIAYSTSKKFTKATTKTTTLTGTKKTLTKLTPGKTYYVKVRAYVLDGAKNKVYGSYSSVKNITLAPNKANAPTLKNNKSKQLTVSFKKVANAKGYQITYSTSKKFTKATTKTITVTKNSAVLKNLKKGKTYYVKVRAFVKNPSNKNVYGAYSTVKTIKIKK